MKKILVVDDDHDILEPLSLVLELEGYEVETLSRGEQTYGKIKEFHPDLVLLDILMSGSDGRVICNDLKDKQDTKDIPIVMMSAHPAAKHESKDCGADDFIAKPFDVNELVTLIRKFTQN